jgi:hypothetical protein
MQIQHQKNILNQKTKEFNMVKYEIFNLRRKAPHIYSKAKDVFLSVLNEPPPLFFKPDTLKNDLHKDLYFIFLADLYLYYAQIKLKALFQQTCPKYIQKIVRLVLYNERLRWKYYILLRSGKKYSGYTSKPQKVIKGRGNKQLFLKFINNVKLLNRAKTRTYYYLKRLGLLLSKILKLGRRNV